MSRLEKFLDAPAALLVVDMQRLFAEETEWRVPSIPDILPNVVRLVDRDPARAILTRFVTPETPSGAERGWQAYYQRWQSVTTRAMGEAMLDVMAELAGFAPPAAIVDKPTYSAFAMPETGRLLRRLGAETVVCCGVETDVCVLGTVIGAIDAGYRAVVVADACTSSDMASHRAALDHIFRRFEDQIVVADTAEVLRLLGGAPP